MQFLNDKEKKIFGVMYRLGSAPISAIAKEAMLNRTALYHTIQKLVHRGLVTTVQKEGVAFFEPVSVEEYEQWSQRKVDEFVQQTNDLKVWLQEQEGRVETLQSEIRYYEGLDGVRSIYDDTWRDNPEKVIYAITDYDKAYAALNDFMEKDYFPTRVKKGIRVKSLLPSSAVTGKRDKPRAKQLLREMRFVDLFKDLGIEINIYNAKLAIVAFDPKKPSGVIIKNEIIARAFKEIFEFIWKKAKT